MNAYRTSSPIPVHLVVQHAILQISQCCLADSVRACAAEIALLRLRLSMTVFISANILNFQSETFRLCYDFAIFVFSFEKLML